MNRGARKIIIEAATTKFNIILNGGFIKQKIHGVIIIITLKIEIINYIKKHKVNAT